MHIGVNVFHPPAAHAVPLHPCIHKETKQLKHIKSAAIGGVDEWVRLRFLTMILGLPANQVVAAAAPLLLTVGNFFNKAAALRNQGLSRRLR